MNQIDEALASLGEACDEKNGNLVYLNVDPTLKRLRSDARFEEILRRVNWSLPSWRPLVIVKSQPKIVPRYWIRAITRRAAQSPFLVSN